MKGKTPQPRGPDRPMTRLSRSPDRPITPLMKTIIPDAPTISGARTTSVRRSARDRSGFALVEMAIVLVILGILIAAAVPDLARSNRTRRVEAAANDMSARIQLARQRTLASRIPNRIAIERDARLYRIERLADDSTWVRDPDEDYALPPGVDWSVEAGSDPTNADVEFESRGTILAEDAPLTVHFTNSQGDSTRLSLVRTGRCVVRRGAE